jgi:hypothetical protein
MSLRVQILSDLHLEHCRRFAAEVYSECVPPVVGDVLILAGDIDIGTRGMAAYRAAGVPVVYVCGNHELYRGHLNQVYLELAQCAREMGVHFLSEGCAVVDGVRFLGTTLWTDFALYPGREHESIGAAKRSINDFSLIRTSHGVFTPEQSVVMHRVARSWLRRQLESPFDGPTVVVTHHAPSRLSVAPRFENDPLTPAFVSDMEELAGLAPLWIHGHCHDSSDYLWGGTRVIANPRGYPRNGRMPLQWENPAFDPALCVEI